MTARRRRLGKLPLRYRFALNPFSEVRWSKCPLCEKLTYNRKFPLLIHVDQHGPVILARPAGTVPGASSSSPTRPSWRPRCSRTRSSALILQVPNEPEVSPWKTCLERLAPCGFVPADAHVRRLPEARSAGPRVGVPGRGGHALHRSQRPFHGGVPAHIPLRGLPADPRGGYSRLAPVRGRRELA